MCKRGKSGRMRDETSLARTPSGTSESFTLIVDDPHSLTPCNLISYAHSKQSTDKAYDDALDLLIKRLATDLHANPSGVPGLGVYFGTHNKESCNLIKDHLISEGLGKIKGAHVSLMPGVAGRVCTGQLYGMSDALTEDVARTYENTGTPMASKYLPYGALRDVSASSFFFFTFHISSSCFLGSGPAVPRTKGH